MRIAVLQLVMDSVSKDGSFAKDVIEAATEGVKKFAENQSDWTTHYGAVLAQLVETVVYSGENSMLNGCTGFSKDQIIALVERHYKDTQFMKNLAEKTNYKKPSNYGGLLSNIPVEY